MEIQVSSYGTTLIVSVVGRIDTLSAAEFQGRMEELLQDLPPGLVMDFGRLEYLSSLGLRSIVVIAKKVAKQGSKLTCCSLQPLVRAVFDVSGFSTKINLADSVNEALQQMKL